MAVEASFPVNLRVGAGRFPFFPVPHPCNSDSHLFPDDPVILEFSDPFIIEAQLFPLF